MLDRGLNIGVKVLLDSRKIATSLIEKQREREVCLEKEILCWGREIGYLSWGGNARVSRQTEVSVALWVNDNPS